MPYSSGTFSVVYNFTTEAGSPPIEIAKLTEQFTDIADGMSIAMLRDGTGLPTADQNFNGFKILNVAAATTLTGMPRVTELIDQDHIYYVDSGSANTYVITPSPAIAAYEEGQRFVVRVANASTGASTLNVNSLGAIAIQHPDGSAIIAGDLAAGGIFEFTYDANTNPDRWVLTSPGSQIADGMLSSNVPLKDAANAFSANQAIQKAAAVQVITSTNAAAAYTRYDTDSTTRAYVGADGGSSMIVGLSAGDAFVRAVSGGFGVSGNDGTTLHFFLSAAGVLTTPNASSAEVGYKGTPQNVQDGNYTLVLTDAGRSIDKQAGGAGETITIPANASVAFPIGTVISGDNDGGGTLTIAITSDTLEDTLGNTGSRTVADNGNWVVKKIAATKWRITGSGIS